MQMDAIIYLIKRQIKNSICGKQGIKFIVELVIYAVTIMLCFVVDGKFGVKDNNYLLSLIFGIALSTINFCIFLVNMLGKGILKYDYGDKYFLWVSPLDRKKIIVKGIISKYFMEMIRSILVTLLVVAFVNAMFKISIVLVLTLYYLSIVAVFLMIYLRFKSILNRSERFLTFEDLSYKKNNRVRILNSKPLVGKGVFSLLGKKILEENRKSFFCGLEPVTMIVSFLIFIIELGLYQTRDGSGHGLPMYIYLWLPLLIQATLCASIINSAELKEEVEHIEYKIMPSEMGKKQMVLLILPFFKHFLSIIPALVVSNICFGISTNQFMITLFLYVAVSLMMLSFNYVIIKIVGIKTRTNLILEMYFKALLAVVGAVAIGAVFVGLNYFGEKVGIFGTCAFCVSCYLIICNVALIK